jgi:formylglycine-generating enzyme required for sulfatase activity
VYHNPLLRLLAVIVLSGSVSNLAAGNSLAAEFSNYLEPVPGAETAISMIPITGGKFLMGSHESEPGHTEAERPQHEVNVGDFWIGQYEVTWAQYEVFVYRNDDFDSLVSPQALAELAIDGVTGASAPYTMTGMGDRELESHPAGSVTQHAALSYARWLSAKTGRFYRLPTEAEWEYACRAGTDTTWSFGSDPAAADDYAVYDGNSDRGGATVGSRQPNPWQLYDMHGNVTEWTMDQYAPDFYANSEPDNPINRPTTLFPRVTRGGSWAHPLSATRCAARLPSNPDWKEMDPQLPRSAWWHTDAPFVGFRLVRPRVQPSPEEIQRYWLEVIEDYGT